MNGVLKKLKEVTSIQMGHSFRTRLEPDVSGNVSVIQMKDLTEDNRLSNQGLAQVEMRNLKDHHRATKNDLAFRSRGQTNTAALINVNVNQAVIAAPLLRIRVENESIIPAYLCWFINQPLSQSVLQSKATGTAMRTIGKLALEELEVVVPDLEIQRHIVVLDRLSSNEQRLMKQLAEKKKQLIEGSLMRLATRASPLT